MKSKTKQQRRLKVKKTPPLKTINENVAGIDVGSAEIWVAVPHDRCEEQVRMYPTFTEDLLQMGAWLRDCRITSVAMESTGVYWIPIYDVLNLFEIEVCLIDPRKIKSSRKTDVLDCQRLQQLHSYSLLEASFRPPQEIRAVRTITRQQQDHIRDRKKHEDRIDKTLHEMNIQLDNVLANIMCQTGLKIIRAIVAGEHDPKVLAENRDPHCKCSKEEIIKSLEGVYLEEHLFSLRQNLQLYDFYTAMIDDCQIKLLELYGSFPRSAACEDDLPTTAKKNRKNRRGDTDADVRLGLYHLCGVDLTEIDGLDCRTVQNLIGEVGLDLLQWESDKHFCSWTTLAPNNKFSGGKKLPWKYQKSKHRVAQLFRMAASTLKRSNTALGAFYRRILLKSNSKAAVKATAHKLARIFYIMLKYKVPYKAMDQKKYDEQYRTRKIKSLERQAKKLEMQLVPCQDLSAT